MSQAASPSHINEISPLHCLIVRPITADERSDWDTLMATHHYLGFRSLVGESIRYVAALQGQWVALLGWCAAALNPDFAVKYSSPLSLVFQGELDIALILK